MSVEITIVNVATGETEIRPMTADELKDYEKIKTEQMILLNEIQVKEAKRQEVLSKLGLTPEEAQALLG